jgi:hypothetical protein
MDEQHGGRGRSTIEQDAGAVLWHEDVPDVRAIVSVAPD